MSILLRKRAVVCKVTAARFVQGIGVDGEYGTSATYLSKTAGARYCGFWSSFQCLTLMSGQLLALQLGLQQLFMPAQLGA